MTDRPAGETRAWKSPKPCYSKSKLVGAVAIAIDTKIFSEDGLTLDAKLEWLHSVHLLLDEVVLKFKAEKFSGSCGSYLITKACDTEQEAASVICQIGEEVLELNPKASLIGAAADFGEVGFGVLGSTGWNYQFYGKCIETLKLQALAEGSDGKLHKTQRLCKILEESSEKPSSLCGQQFDEGQESPDNLPCSYEEWRGRDSQLIELWVIVVTLLMSLLGISGAWEKTNNSRVHLVPFLCQLHCFLSGIYVLCVWFGDHERFVKDHSFYMALVWASQFINRIIGSLVMPLATEKLFDLHFIVRLIAANGPAKLLLTTTPLVSWQRSMILHCCGTFSAIMFSIRSCSLRDPKKDIPYDCTRGGQMMVIMLNIVVLCIIPIFYAFYRNQTSSKEYMQIKGSKQQ